MSQRDRQIATDYLGGRAASSLAGEYGLSEVRIWQILSSQGVSGHRKGRRVLSKVPAGQVISEVHEILGRRLGEARLNLEIDSKELAKRLNWSQHRLTAVMRGQKELTLTDLLEISRLLDISVGEILLQCGAQE